MNNPDISIEQVIEERLTSVNEGDISNVFQNLSNSENEVDICNGSSLTLETSSVSMYDYFFSFHL